MARLLSSWLVSLLFSPLPLAFGASFGSFFASDAVVASTHFIRDNVTFGDDSSGLFWGDRGAVHIIKLIRAILQQDDAHPIQEMGGTSTHGLVVVVAFVHHLVIIDEANLRVVAARDVPS